MILEIIALIGFAASSLVWVIVALTTPVPVMLIDAAKIGARRVHEKLPPEIRERIPLPGQFLLKDLVLSGVALWTVGDALAALKAFP